MSRLAEILDHKREEVEARRRIRPLAETRSMAADAAETRPFLGSLAACPYPVGLIAEIKRASPSAGAINTSLDVAETAQAYERAGAQCLSVLTDERFFAGSDENLIIARRSCGLPCLRKDFVVDAYQIYEARSLGADAILLIVAALTPSELSEFHALAEDLGMAALVEVHDEAEAEIAMTLTPPLVGINNRNLKNFEVDLSTTQGVAPLLNGEALVVSESGIASRMHVDQVAAWGARAVLVGTAFCAAPDLENEVRQVMRR